MVIVIAGVSGAGKTTVGRALAARTGFAFAEGDEFHPAANVAKMRAGEPLDDRDRAPWLDRLAAAIDEWLGEGRDVVLTCSALRRAYRDRLRRGRAGVRILQLDVPRAVLEQRLRARTGHFMPASLLASQLATLEPPADAEDLFVVPAADAVDRIVDRILAALDLPTAAGHHDPP